MVEKPSGDPARQLTRAEVTALHEAMSAAEPDWVHAANVLASTLEAAIFRLSPGQGAVSFQTVVNEYRRDVEAWHRAADAYFRAVGGPVEELLPLEEEAF